MMLDASNTDPTLFEPGAVVVVLLFESLCITILNKLGLHALSKS